MEEKRGFKITGITMTMKANDQIYDGQDKQIVLTINEDGSLEWELSDNLYDMLTEGERKKLEQLAHAIIELLLSCVV